MPSLEFSLDLISNKKLNLVYLYFLKNIDNLMTPEGVGLTTALRVLCNVACPPPPVEGNMALLKLPIFKPRMSIVY